MKEADAYTIQNVGIPSLVLMERAALGVVEAMEQGRIHTGRALVVCGSGNNGGDGFAVARLLRERGGRADVLFAGRDESMSEECRLQREIAHNCGVGICTTYPDCEYSVIIDAVFGVGLSRKIEGRYKDVIEWMNRQPAEKVAVDIPSGICSVSGKVLGAACRADLTVALACEKLGCALFPGSAYAGRVVTAQIGIPPSFFQNDPGVCFTYEKEDLAGLLPARPADSHKGSYGKVLMITGSSSMAGAAFLSAAAAYTAGAGLVRVYTDRQNRPILQELLPEAVISDYAGYDEKELDSLLDWADVVCIGCGLGTGEVSERVFLHTVGAVKVPCVIDADGINLLSRHMDRLGEIDAPVVLTPHMKEMSRMTGRSVEELSENRMEAVREFTRKYQVVCALKDSRTIVASEGERTFVNLAGNSAMAKAGAGDVLAGVITGLLAQGKSPFAGASLGVWLHALGGDEAKAAKGAYSVLARDLMEGIQTCMKHAKESVYSNEAIQQGVCRD